MNTNGLGSDCKPLDATIMAALAQVHFVSGRPVVGTRRVEAEIALNLDATWGWGEGTRQALTRRGADNPLPSALRPSPLSNQAPGVSPTVPRQGKICRMAETLADYIGRRTALNSHQDEDSMHLEVP